MNEFQTKVEQLRQLLHAKQLGGIWITLQKNFSWLTAGRAFVNMAAEQAAASILVTAGQVILIVNNIEADRLLEEETTAQFDEVRVFPWFEPSQPFTIVSDYAGTWPVETDALLEPEFTALRTVLTEWELERIKQLGKWTAWALEQTAKDIRQGDSELEMAGRLAANCLKMGVEPIVNLVAADERAFARRHPLPTSRRLASYAMLVVCGRHKGQIVSATRLVHFGALPPDLLQRHRAVSEIDSLLIHSTVAGRAFSGLFETMKAAYADAGYAGEWQNHHQGGLSGYASREQLLLPGGRHIVQDRQVYAWNPSISGVKSEDTIVVNGAGAPQIVTQSGDFPLIDIQYEGSITARPDILIRRRYV